MNPEHKPWLNRSRGVALVLATIVTGAAIAVVLGARKQDAPAAGAKPVAAITDGMAGMDMSSGGEAVLTDDVVRQFSITFNTVEQRMLSSEVRTTGIVRTDERRVAQVAPRFAGFAEQVHADFTGKLVRRGQSLVEAYSPELVAAQEELLLASRLATGTTSDVPGAAGSTTDLVAPARQRLRQWGMTDADIAQILRSGQVRRNVSIYAPISGMILEKSIVRGQAFMAGQALYTIADLSVVWVDAEVREADAGIVSRGTSASVEFAALPGRPVSGVVDFVSPVLQSETRTVRARIVLPNQDGRVRPGMYATVRLSTPLRSALTVPTAAVVGTGERRVVFVDLGGGRLAPRVVEIGRVTSGLSEVLSGLEAGQRVVTSAQYLLDSESNLADVMRSMMSQTGTGDMDMGPPPDTSAAALKDKGANMRGVKPPVRR